MSKKQFDKFFIANLKRTAQMVSPMVRRKQKLQQEIAEREEEINSLNSQISSLDSHIRAVTNYGVEDLVKRTVIDTGKKDKAGNPVKITKWELIYPDTIVPGIGTTSSSDVLPYADGTAEEPVEEATEEYSAIENDFLN